MKVKFKRFGKTFTRTETTLKNAAEFASGISQDRLINITSDREGSVVYVVVWYWE